MKRYISIIIAITIFSTVSFAQTLSDAIMQTNNEQFETAEATFKNLIAAAPNKGENYFYFGENYFNNDNLEMAMKTYQKGIEMNATDPLCYVGLGKVQWYQHKATEAKANFYKATTLAEKKDATPFLKIAEVYIKADTKDLTEAFILIAKAIKFEPNKPEGYILKGDAFLEKNNGTKAIENYEKASTLNPKSVTAILRQGQLFYRAKNYNLALDLYKQASLIDSSFAPAYREKAEIYFLAGQYANATAQYKRYLELNNNCSARGRYAGFLNQAKKYKESVEAATEAIKCNPDNAYLYRYKGYSQYEVKDYANGLESVNTFFEMASKSAKINLIAEDYEYRARLYSKLHKDSTLVIAIADFKKALELDPTKSKINGDIAKMYTKMKMYPEAIAAYKSKMENGKPNANDYFGLGRAYYYSKDFANADTAFTHITISNPSLPLGYLWRAKANVQMDPKNEGWLAKPFYEQYIEKMDSTDKKLVNAYTYMGVYFMNNKNNCEAKTYFQKIQELDPENDNSKKFLESAEAKKCP